MKVFEKYNLIVSSDDIDTVVGGIHATSWSRISIHK
jgi:hypothetical protein